MTEISITGTIYKYFDHIEETEIRQNIIMYMEKYNIGNKGISTITKHKLKFKNQIGGKASEIELKYTQEIKHCLISGAHQKIINTNNFLGCVKKYYYNINDIEPVGKSKYKMLFLTFDDINECACLTFGKKESNNTVLRIDGIKSFDTQEIKHRLISGAHRENNHIFSECDCILCNDKKHKFKSGDILMQIILELVKNDPRFSHIDKIELSDSSQKKCYDIGLKLIYLRTMTHGIPYYAKFGFRPMLKTDYEDVFIHNRNNFKLNKTMSKKDLFEIIKKKKINMSNKTYVIYEKYIKKHILNNENIDPVIFISQTIKIVDNSMSKNKNKNIKIIDDTQEIKHCLIYGAHHKILLGV